MTSDDRALEIARRLAPLAGQRRADEIARTCDGDRALRDRVERLLEQQDSQTIPAAAISEGASHEPVTVLGQTEGSTAGNTFTRKAGPLPQRIGRYTIMGELGEGGMGMVYLAEQDRPRRTVALKVIRPGLMSPTLLRRFEHESQILGRLQHPGIAQVYEAGRFDQNGVSQPYFAMELVRGVSLTEYCRHHALDAPARLRLLARVCDAVQHAHTKGVIHRDLKPGNIVVPTADGTSSGPRAAVQPKILDFGVARATEADVATMTMQTQAGQLVGTLPYMSPEQIAGNPDDVDALSDVYALGVILYELLAGRRPHVVEGKTLVEAARTIGHDEPVPLGSLDRSLRGDLQTIAGKALEKDKSRRYPSAAELAADIHRYLADEPILARPPTTAYQLRKFARRNKGLVAGAGIAILALLGGIAATTWQAVEATRGRRLAEDRRLEAEAAHATAAEEAANARAMNEFLEHMLASVDPEASMGREVTMREVLDQAAHDVGGAFAERPRIEASLRGTLARTYLGIARLEEAEASARRAVELRRTTLGAEHPDTLESMRMLAGVLAERGRLEEALGLAEDALTRTERRVGPDSLDAALARGDVARVVHEMANLPQAESLFRRSLEVVERHVGRDDQRSLTLRHNLSITLKDQGRFDDAIALQRPVLEARQRLLGPDHPLTLASLNNLAATLQKKGEASGAAELLSQALESRRRVLGNEHHATLTSALNLGVTLVSSGSLDAAEPLIREAMAGLETTLGEEHTKTQIAINSLAYLVEERGDLDEAERLYRRCVAIKQRIKGRGDQETWGPMNNLAMLLQRRGRLDDASALFEELLAGCRAALPPGHYYTAIFENNYGDCLTQMARYEAAEQMLKGSLEPLATTLGAGHPRTSKARARLVALYQAWGKPELAATYR